MSNCTIQRDHTGTLHLTVSGHFASGARVSSISEIGGELSAVVIIPLTQVVFEEQSTVVPFKRDG